MAEGKILAKVIRRLEQGPSEILKRSSCGTPERVLCDFRMHVNTEVKQYWDLESLLKIGTFIQTPMGSHWGFPRGFQKKGPECRVRRPSAEALCCCLLLIFPSRLFREFQILFLYKLNFTLPLIITSVFWEGNSSSSEENRLEGVWGHQLGEALRLASVRENGDFSWSRDNKDRNKELCPKLKPRVMLDK